MLSGSDEDIDNLSNWLHTTNTQRFYGSSQEIRSLIGDLFGRPAWLECAQIEVKTIYHFPHWIWFDLWCGIEYSHRHFFQNK